MSAIRQLQFAQIAPGRDFHAALILTHPRTPGATLHTHDFWEMMYALEGSGTHWINGEAQRLQAGDLLWIRPPDTHAICGRVGERLHFINVAFAASAWAEFRSAAGLEETTAAWDAGTMPPVRRLSPPEREACASAFERALHVFHARPARLDLCRLWTETLPMLLPKAAEETVPTAAMPPWLLRACQALEAQPDLQQGVPRLVELAGVGPAHLSRVLKSCTGQTPTEFVNGLRLRRATTLLLTTSQEIAQIALDCGFENLSYFYRRFGQAYGRTPRAFRLEARRGVIPTY